MSCVLRAIGTSFDVDAFLADSALKPEPFYRGAARLAGAPDSPKHTASGFNLSVSARGFEDLDTQIEDAVGFLNDHEEELRRLGSFPGLEEVCLDFGLRRRATPAQSDIFPAELLWRAGALDIDLVVTHYTILDEES